MNEDFEAFNSYISDFRTAIDIYNEMKDYEKLKESKYVYLFSKFIRDYDYSNILTIDETKEMVAKLEAELYQDNLSTMISNMEYFMQFNLKDFVNIMSSIFNVSLTSNVENHNSPLLKELIKVLEHESMQLTETPNIKGRNSAIVEKLIDVLKKE